MTDHGHNHAHPIARGAVTALIVAVLTLQGLAGFKVLCPPRTFEALASFRVACAPTLWPFLDYNMYNGARFPGWTGTQRTVVAQLDDGSLRPIEPEEVGLSPHDYSRWFVDDVTDGRHLSASGHVARWTGPSERVVALRVDLSGYRLEEDGSMSPLEVQHGRWLDMPERGGAR